jgi:4-amino-4-deoxy-L-arabinose transferase-like glycosyltransferase
VNPSGRAGGLNRPAVVAALIVLWLTATAWMRPLMLPDEGRYVGVAWEMMRSGDWLIPTLNGLPFFHKPPLFYWITAGSMTLFGLHEWAARAAPLLGAFGGAFSLYLFTRRWSGERAARLTLIALLAQPLFYVGGQFANLDMLVAGCITATIVLLAHAALSIERGLPYRAALAGAYAAAAAGVLAKGLIGFVIPALVVATWLLMLRRWRVLMSLVWIPGLLLFVLLAAPWFVAMQARFPEFLDYFFVVQHFKRFALTGFNNVQPFWFFPAALVLFSLPWLPWLHRLFARGYLTDPERSPIRLLMWLWVLMVVLFFSLPRSKLLGYILPAVPPLAALMADGFVQLGTPSARARRLWWASVAVTCTLSLAIIIGLAIRPPNSLRELASTLGTQHAPNEPVFMLARYYYDVPFYAKLRGPTRVVDDWASADVRKRDNWRKELADAGEFSAARSTRFCRPPRWRSPPATPGCGGSTPMQRGCSVHFAAKESPVPAQQIGSRRHGDQHDREHQVVALSAPAQQQCISGLVDGEAAG